MAGKFETWFDAYDADCREHKREVPVARLAAVYNVSDQTVYNQQHGHSMLTFEQYSQYCTELRRTGAAPMNLAAWVCRQAGLMCAPLPTAASGIDARLPRMLSEFGDVTKALAEAMEDGQVTALEAERVWVEGEQAISAILGVMCAARQAVTTTPLRPATMAEAATKNGGVA